MEISFKLSQDKTGKDQRKADYANAFIGFPVQRNYQGLVAGFGQMSFEYGANARTDVYSKTTLEAILNGERTATTRYSYQESIGYWKKFKVGDVIKWKGKNNQVSFVQITKPLSKLPANTSVEEWSKKEGWSTDYFNQMVKPNLNDAFQMEFKPIALSSTGVYLLDARRQDIPTNHAIKCSRETIAFVSVSSEGHHVDKTADLAKKVLQNGGSIIMDKGGCAFGQSHSKFNIKGEGAVQDKIAAAYGNPKKTPEGYHYWGDHSLLSLGLRR